jgi:hypothetical protein
MGALVDHCAVSMRAATSGVIEMPDCSRYGAIVAALLMVGGCRVDTGTAIRWRTEASDALAEGDCRLARRLLVDVEESGRDEVWHQLSMISCVACAANGAEAGEGSLWGAAAAEKAAQSFPNSARLALLAGRCLASVGRKDLAMMQYERAATLAHGVLAAAHADAPAKDEARAVLRLLPSQGLER